MPNFTRKQVASAMEAGIVHARGNRSSIVGRRLLLPVSAAAAAHTCSVMLEAPGHFDAVRAIILGLPAANANAHTASFAVTAKPGNGYIAVDASDVPQAPQPFLWGSTDLDDTRNPGAANSSTQLSGGSGASGSDGGNLTESRAISNWLFVKSLTRADDPALKPLFIGKLHSPLTPSMNLAGASSGAANPFRLAEPNFFCGYFGAGVDHTLTTSPPAPTQGYIPSMMYEFLLRGQRGITLAVPGDSLVKGYIAPTAVPTWGGGIDGWVRKLVRMLADEAGIPIGLVNLSWEGYKSQRFHGALLAELQRPSCVITNAGVPIWSTNQIGDGMAGVAAAISSANEVFAACEHRRVSAFAIRPWPGQSAGTPAYAAVQAYCDNLEAAGRPVFDARRVVGGPTDRTSPLPEFLTRDANGDVVDYTHINEACAIAVARHAFNRREYLGLI